MCSSSAFSVGKCSLNAASSDATMQLDSCRKCSICRMFEANEVSWSRPIGVSPKVRADRSQVPVPTPASAAFVASATSRDSRPLPLLMLTHLPLLLAHAYAFETAGQ